MRSEGYGTWFVCLSVCHPEFWHYRLCDGHPAIPAASALQGHENERGIFPETTAYQRYGVITSEKPTSEAIAHAPLASGYAGAHVSCQEADRDAHTHQPEEVAHNQHS